MKKLATILGIVLLITTLAVPVFARGRRWGMGGNMMGNCGGGPGYYGQSDRGYGYQGPQERGQPDQPQEEFYNETGNLRNQIRTKSTELDALLNGPNPDIEKARAIQKEISQLQAKMDEKRLNYELEERKSAPGGSYGRGYDRGGYGRGYGPGMRGYGPGMGRNY